MTTVPTRIEIPAFPGGRRVAVTTSWDDGRVYDRWVVAALNNLGMKGTFNLNSSFLTRNGHPLPDESGGYLDACEVSELYAGHEVAIHSLTHPCLDRLDVTQIVAEVLDDRRNLEELAGYPVRGMAYPYGTYNSQVIAVLRTLGIVYSRTVEHGVTNFPPPEPLALPTTMHILHQQPTSLPERWEAFYQNQWTHGLFYIWGHSYEFAQDRSALQRLLAPLAGKPDVWYCTNIELFDYDEARRRLVLAANKKTVYNPSAIPVTVMIDGVPREVAPGVVKLG